MSYLGYKMLKPEFDNDKALEIAAWCNETQSATWQDMGNYYECVEVEPPEPHVPTTEEKIARLDGQYQSDKQVLQGYYVGFMIAGNVDGMEAIKQELADLAGQYDTDLAVLKGGE